MKTQSCKAKGRRLQQQVRDKILSCFDHLTLDDVRSTSMGAGGEDVQLSTEARRCVPFSFECKNVEKLNVWGAIDQAKDNCPKGSDPVLIMKKNGRDAYAVIHMDAFFELILSKKHAQETKPDTETESLSPKHLDVSSRSDDKQDKKRTREEQSEEIRNVMKRFVKNMNELLDEA